MTGTERPPDETPACFGKNRRKDAHGIRPASTPQTAQWTAAIFRLAFTPAGLLARHKPVLIHFAIVASAVRLWTYHFAYDNGVMIFMLVATGIAAIRRRTPAMWTAFLACGATLRPPASLLDKPPAQLLQYIIWTVLACALIWRGSLWIQPESQSPLISPDHFLRI